MKPKIHSPKPIVNALKFESERNHLLITPKRPSRQGWAKSFKAASSSNKDTVPLDFPAQSDFDRHEWEW